MLDINILRKEPKLVKKGIGAKNVDPSLVDKVLELDKKVKQFISRIEELRHEQKKKSKKKLDKKEMLELKHDRKTIKTLEMGLKQYSKERERTLSSLPNLPAKDVEVGKDEKENEVLRKVGERSKFDFKPSDYLSLSEKLDLIDMKQAAKVSGTRFGYIKGKLTVLQNALLQYAYQKLLEENFTPVAPPLLIKDEIMKGLGYVEGIEEQDKYHLKKDKLYLVGTAEHSLIPLHSFQILKNNELPKRYFAHSPAFRREAGSYGKDTKGIFRSHQFDKMEMVSFCLPENGDKEQDKLLALAETLVKGLKIPYRVTKMCTGDLAFPSARTFDIEMYIPSQNKYRETHSCSTCTDFQARRLSIKFRDKNNKTRFVHTLNSTVFALGRTLIAIIENYQTKEGTIKIPEALQKYCHFDEIK